MTPPARSTDDTAWVSTAATTGFLGDLLAGRRTAVVGSLAGVVAAAIADLPGERVVDPDPAEAGFEAVLVVESEPTRQLAAAGRGTALGVDGAVLVVWCTDTASLRGLVDPTTPVAGVAAPVSRETLRAAGAGPLRSYPSYGDGAAVISERVLTADHLGGLTHAVVAGAVAGDDAGRETVHRLAAAGALSALADGWWAVAGGGARSCHTDGYVADLRPGHRDWTITTTAGRTWSLPVGASVEHRLRAAEQQSDLQTVRSLAGALGRWCSGPERPVRAVGWELVFGDADAASPEHPSGLVPVDLVTGEPVPPQQDPEAVGDADAPDAADGVDAPDEGSETLDGDDAGAGMLRSGWVDHLRRRRHRRGDDLWPADRTDAEVLAELLTYAGVDDAGAADNDDAPTADAAGTGAGDETVELLRRRLADAEELADRYRQQLTHRERHIHDVRSRWIEQEARAAEAEGSLKRITGSRAWQAVQAVRFLRTIRRPKVFAREAAGHARTGVRALRRRLMQG